MTTPTPSNLSKQLRKPTPLTSNIQEYYNRLIATIPPKLKNRIATERSKVSPDMQFGGYYRKTRKHKSKKGYRSKSYRNRK
jgi:hypothetical protein